MNMTEYLNLVNKIIYTLDNRQRYREDQRDALILAYASLAMAEYYEAQIEALTKTIKT